MDNLFNSDNYPDGVPAELVLGVDWAFKHSELSDAYPVGTHSAKLILNLLTAAGGTQEITATESGSNYIFQAADSDTLNFTAGDYAFQIEVTETASGDKRIAEEGFVTFVAAVSAGGDQRSHTLKTLQAIQANIEGTATKEQQSYQVAGRMLSRRSITELLELEQEYSDRWEAEKAASDRKRGKKRRGRVQVKMGGN